MMSAYHNFSQRNSRAAKNNANYLSGHLAPKYNHLGKIDKKSFEYIGVTDNNANDCSVT